MLKYYAILIEYTGKERLPALSDRSELSYTEAVLYESMRLTSVLPIGIMRMTLCDTSIGKLFLFYTKIW